MDDRLTTSDLLAASQRRTATLADAERVLTAVWGFPRLRTHQRPVVAAALHGRDCLAVLPTGGGKSLCFQVPALALRGLTVVVSPLISLMQDQVAALRERGVRAAYLSSTQRSAVRAAIRAALRRNELQLLYVAPERLGTLVFDVPGGVSLIAVDEAHCISEWGHDFRPHFRAIGRHAAALGRPPMIALTATATPDTRADIIRVLGLRNPVTVVRSFDRPNLRLEVARVRDELERAARTVTLLKAVPGPAIVYVATRRRTDGITAVLRRWGIPALPYHAGLASRARTGILTRFLDGRCRVVVATNAFGMGIDKPDVRLVVHLGVPMRPESYYQEAGRAGRDGLPSRCVLLWRPPDLALADRLGRTRGSGPPSSAVAVAARERGTAAMRRFIHTRRCRRRVLLQYLGERTRACGGCDRCG